ncbi:hypothetical protein [Roseomonas fluvialis]|uniref:Uncharacterized protein n=1 Tax=Roseomonas fluvialis TaxID=1750527 RepID=A0ABN6P906_9PROT|nr:hypothetical protein [Roseomonas fluvialis]BDG75331.1 hypothetical protein Rmf_52600 [Roseomonas fluvialis]
MRLLPTVLALIAGLPAAAREPLHLTERVATRLVGLRVEIRDLRLGSPGFGRGVDPVLLADPGWFAAQHADARRIAPLEDTGLPPEAFEAWAARTGGFCRVTVGGPDSALPAPAAAARMAGVLRPDGTPDPGRIAVHRIDIAALDRFTLDHELGHCRDSRLRFATLSALALSGSGPRIAESRHGFEVFADIVAALEFLRAAPGPDPAAVVQEIANLRQVSVVTNFRRGALGRDGRILLAPALAYHTAPALDAVLALAQSRGLAWLRARSAAEIVALAEELRARRALSRADQALLTRALADTRLRTTQGGAALRFSPELPRTFLDRFDRAAAEQRFRPAPHEAPPATQPTAWQRASAPQPLLDARGALRQALEPDLRDGAVPLRVAPLPGGVTRVVLRERDGARSAVVLRANGDVLRLSAAGRIASLGPDRPALLRGQVAVHVVADERLDAEAAEAWFTGPLEGGLSQP